MKTFTEGKKDPSLLESPLKLYLTFIKMASKHKVLIRQTENRKPY